MFASSENHPAAQACNGSNVARVAGQSEKEKIKRTGLLRTQRTGITASPPRWHCPPPELSFSAFGRNTWIRHRRRLWQRAQLQHVLVGEIRGRGLLRAHNREAVL